MRAVAWLDLRAAGGVVLKDAGGSVKAIMHASATGTPQLFFFDDTGKERITLTLLAGGQPTLELNDRSGIPRFTLKLLLDKFAQYDSH